LRATRDWVRSPARAGFRTTFTPSHEKATVARKDLPGMRQAVQVEKEMAADVGGSEILQRPMQDGETQGPSRMKAGALHASLSRFAA